jgi:catechol 2,3-dioxygenase-like lactoylglutathione lyase family enzyme
MIGYTTFGTNDLERAGKFYDGLFAVLGGKRAMATDGLILWATGPGTPMVGVIKPHDGKTATRGNGTMIALAAKDKAQVDAIYAKAIELGGTDEGKPGPRGGNFYAGYFRDLDGNKLNAFFMG